MKRAPFLGATAVLVLSACGGRQVLRALPGVAPNSSSNSLSSTGFVPSVADPIPQSVLSNPIIGEARRFDGTVIPGGWLLMQGATLSVSEYGQLFHVLGTVGGGDGKTAFKLPAPKQGWIVAAAGTFPTSPQMLASGVRHPTAQASLGAGARPGIPSLSAAAQRTMERRSAALREQQRLAQSAIVARSGPSIRLSPAVAARMASAREDARTAVLQGLSSANRAQALRLVESVLAGSTTVFEATRRMTASLSLNESATVLDAFDQNQRALGGPTVQHTDLAAEAGRYAIAVAFSAEQLRTLRAMQRDD